MVATNAYPALLLNADFRPLSVSPLATLPWQEAVGAALSGKILVVAEYEREVRSPSRTMHLPSVVARRVFQDLSHPARLSRQNLATAWGSRCGYCGVSLASEEITFDHILPRSRGGASAWANLALACVACNTRKGNRTPEEAGMRLRQAPRQLTQAELNRLARVRPERIAERSWLDVLYWQGALET
jgi:5-methylcytosine-specific restriction endonuclease McrA